MLFKNNKIIFNQVLLDDTTPDSNKLLNFLRVLKIDNLFKSNLPDGCSDDHQEDAEQPSSSSHLQPPARRAG